MVIGFVKADVGDHQAFFSQEWLLNQDFFD